MLYKSINVYTISNWLQYDAIRSVQFQRLMNQNTCLHFDNTYLSVSVSSKDYFLFIIDIIALVHDL